MKSLLSEVGGCWGCVFFVIAMAIWIYWAINVVTVALQFLLP